MSTEVDKPLENRGFFVACCLLWSGLVWLSPRVMTVFLTVSVHAVKTDTVKKEKSPCLKGLRRYQIFK